MIIDENSPGVKKDPQSDDSFYYKGDLISDRDIQIRVSSLFVKGKIECGGSIDAWYLAATKGIRAKYIRAQRIHVTGCVTAYGGINCTYGIDVKKGDLLVDGDLTCGEFVVVDGNIKAHVIKTGWLASGKSIIANWINSNDSIHARISIITEIGGITADDEITAGDSIKSAARISAGASIRCKRELSAKSYIFLGLDVNEPERKGERTLGIVRYGKLTSGKIVNIYLMLFKYVD